MILMPGIQARRGLWRNIFDIGPAAGRLAFGNLTDILKINNRGRIINKIRSEIMDILKKKGFPDR